MKVYKLFLLVALFTHHSCGYTKPLAFKTPPTLTYWLIQLFFLSLLIGFYLFRKNWVLRLSQPGLCKIIETKRLGPKSSLTLLEYDGQSFLLLDNQHALILQALAPKDAQ